MIAEYIQFFGHDVGLSKVILQADYIQAVQSNLSVCSAACK